MKARPGRVHADFPCDQPERGLQYRTSKNIEATCDSLAVADRGHRISLADGMELH